MKIATKWTNKIPTSKEKKKKWWNYHQRKKITSPLNNPHMRGEKKKERFEKRKIRVG